MDETQIKNGQKWRLINIINRPDVIVQRVDVYSFTVYWSYEGENRVNESAYEYFLKNFKKVAEA